ncbi:MAG: UbiD family decarboxylase [Chloroflexi bacterium]|nr:UbiD family decarboxylase [Chloroflexota bacterium]
MSTSGEPGERKDLRQFLDQLRRQAPDELLQTRRGVSPHFEISAILARLEASRRYPALYCPEVVGSPWPVVTNLLASRRRLALALDVAERDLNATYREREGRRLQPRLVGDGPVKEVRLRAEQVDLESFPILTHNDKDVAPYITAGAMVVRDPETGIRNLGIYRHQLMGPRKLGIHLSEASHSRLIFEKHVQRGQPMELAITVGHHPAFYLAAVSTVPFGVDEYEVAGGLLGYPLPVVKCETVNLEVPAEAEIVIEGVMPVDEREWEGPLGEVAGLYGKRLYSPVIHVTAVTMRERPIYQDIFSGHLEHQLVGSTTRLGTIYNLVRAACPTVQDVFMPPSGLCRFSCYVAIHKRREGEAKNAIMAAMAADPSIKYCVVVDDDVDIFDDEQVLRAINSRLHADRDAFVIRRAMGNPVDPTGDEERLVTKVGIDATKPLSGFPETIRVPGSDQIRLEEYF